MTITKGIEYASKILTHYIIEALKDARVGNISDIKADLESAIPNLAIEIEERATLRAFRLIATAHPPQNYVELPSDNHGTEFYYTAGPRVIRAMFSPITNKLHVIDPIDFAHAVVPKEKFVATNEFVGPITREEWETIVSWHINN